MKGTNGGVALALVWLPRKLLGRLGEVEMISVRAWPAVTAGCLVTIGLDHLGWERRYSKTRAAHCLSQRLLIAILDVRRPFHLQRVARLAAQAVAVTGAGR